MLSSSAFVTRRTWYLLWNCKGNFKWDGNWQLPFGIFAFFPFTSRGKKEADIHTLNMDMKTRDARRKSNRMREPSKRIKKPPVRKGERPPLCAKGEGCNFFVSAKTKRYSKERWDAGDITLGHIFVSAWVQYLLIWKNMAEMERGAQVIIYKTCT